LDAVAAATDTAAVASWRGGAAVVGQLDASDCDVAPARRAEAPAAGASADDPEALILARCSAQIAAEAGPGAVVHAIGARRQAALLDAAVAALPQSRRGGAGGAGGSRCIVYLPRSVAAARSADALLALLQRAAALRGPDALLVVAIETSSGHEAVQLDRLARIAGWELCQRWTDGFARHALHVLESSARAALLRAR